MSEAAGETTSGAGSGVWGGSTASAVTASAVPAGSSWPTTLGTSSTDAALPTESTAVFSTGVGESAWLVFGFDSSSGASGVMSWSMTLFSTRLSPCDFRDCNILDPRRVLKMLMSTPSGTFSPITSSASSLAATLAGPARCDVGVSRSRMSLNAGLCTFSAALASPPSSRNLSRSSWSAEPGSSCWMVTRGVASRGVSSGSDTLGTVPSPIGLATSACLGLEFVAAASGGSAVRPGAGSVSVAASPSCLRVTGRESPPWRCCRGCGCRPPLRMLDVLL